MATIKWMFSYNSKNLQNVRILLSKFFWRILPTDLPSRVWSPPTKDSLNPVRSTVVLEHVCEDAHLHAQCNTHSCHVLRWVPVCQEKTVRKKSYSAVSKRTAYYAIANFTFHLLVEFLLGQLYNVRSGSVNHCGSDPWTISSCIITFSNYLMSNEIQ